MTPDPKKVRRLLIRGLSRVQAARTLKCRVDAIYQVCPTTNLDRLRAGQAVNLGGILVKRCRACGVTKMLQRFYADDTASGCGAICMQCGHANQTKRGEK